MTDHAPQSVCVHLELKGYTKVSDGIDLITSTERKALQTDVENLMNRRNNNDPSLNKVSAATTLYQWRKRMQAMKIEEELAVLEMDKKDNADGERMIDFYKQEQALGRQQYLKGDEFESDKSLQHKQLALRYQSVQIAELRAREAKFKKETKQKKVKSNSKAVNAKKRKVVSGAQVEKTTWTEKDKRQLKQLNAARSNTHQKYLIELRVIKVGLCLKGLKFETPEARQLFKSFEEATQTITQRARSNRKIQDGKKQGKRKDNMMNLLNAANENVNVRTIVPSKVDPAELEGIARGCLWAEEQLNDIDENDEDFLEKIERIAEDAVAMF
jgi:hypothetical protein